MCNALKEEYDEEEENTNNNNKPNKTTKEGITQREQVKYKNHQYSRSRAGIS